DHTPAFARWEAGDIALDEIPDTPGANRLQRAVGHGGEADTTWIPVKAGWTFLVHSDGVTKAMRLDELGDAMALASSAAACEAICRKVEERGPDDNYTAVVVRVLPDDGSAPAGDATLPSPGPAPAAPPPGPRGRGDTELAADARRGPFNPPDDVSSRRSPLGAIGTGLAVVALALGGYAAMQGSRASGEAAAARADAAALHARVDSLAQRVPPDTAGRLPVTATDTGAKAALPPPPPAPAPATPTPNGR
ncbi:MAG TPA: hypothetical protein VF541_16985, partial [Longimicrobium sp.]